MKKESSGISCASTSSSVVNCGCVSPSLVLWEASVVWLVAKNSPLSWHTGPIYGPSHSAEGSPAQGALGSFPTQNTKLWQHWNHHQQRHKGNPTYIFAKCHWRQNHIITSGCKRFLCHQSWCSLPAFTPGDEGNADSFASVIRWGKTGPKTKACDAFNWAPTARSLSQRFHGRQPARPRK